MNHCVSAAIKGKALIFAYQGHPAIQHMVTCQYNWLPGWRVCWLITQCELFRSPPAPWNLASSIDARRRSVFTPTCKGQSSAHHTRPAPKASHHRSRLGIPKAQTSHIWDVRSTWEMLQISLEVVEVGFPDGFHQRLGIPWQFLGSGHERAPKRMTPSCACPEMVFQAPARPWHRILAVLRQA